MQVDGEQVKEVGAGRGVAVGCEVAAEWRRFEQVLAQDINKRMYLAHTDADSQGIIQWSQADLGVQFASFWAKVLRGIADENRVLLDHHTQFELSFSSALRALLGVDQMVHTTFRGNNLSF